MKINQRSLDFIGNVNVNKLLKDNPSDILNPIAIISPHAGYVFSGDVAASIFNTIDPEKEYDNIFILSTSHTSSYSGAAILDEDIYETPIGNLKINQDINNELKSDIFFYSKDYFMSDHTIEVILPFITKIKHKNIVPIMIGDPRPNLYPISQKLKKYLTNNNLFIISSDFSHYPSYNDAIEIDRNTIEIIKQNFSSDRREFLKNVVIKEMDKPGLVTRMCGWSSYLVLSYMMENVEVKEVKYKNSGDSPYGAKDSVVGYFGIAFCKK